MDEARERVLLARLAGVFFVTAGLTGLLLAALRAPSDGGTAVSTVGPSVGSIGVGLSAWWIPWNRLPRAALFSLVLAALVLKVAGNLIRDADPYLYGIHYGMLFMWIGIALPRGSALACAPLLMVSYLWPCPGFVDTLLTL